MARGGGDQPAKMRRAAPDAAAMGDGAMAMGLGKAGGFMKASAQPDSLDNRQFIARGWRRMQVERAR
jgi:hypothetical protein